MGTLAEPVMMLCKVVQELRCGSVSEDGDGMVVGGNVSILAGPSVDDSGCNFFGESFIYF